LWIICLADKLRLMFTEFEKPFQKNSDNKPAAFLVKEFPEYFIPFDQEDKFCHNNHMSLTRFDNGCNLISASYKQETAVDVEIKFHFPVGSAADPPGKSGLMHLTEHLIAYPYIDFAEANLSSFNASTGIDQMICYMNGLASPQYMDTGIWPLCRKFMENFYHSAENPFVFPKGVETEKQTVIAEANISNADYFRCVTQEIYKAYLSNNNPWLINTLGTESDLISITEADVQQAAKSIFQPQDLTVSVVAHEDDQPVFQTIREYIPKFIQEVPVRPKLTQTYLTEDMFNRMRPDSLSDFQIINTGITNKLATVLYVWKFDYKPFTVSNTALNGFVSLANRAFFRYTRQNGGCYVSSVDRMNVSMSSGLLAFRYDVPADTLTDYHLDGKRRINEVIDIITEPEIQSFVKKQEMSRRIGADRKYAQISDVIWSVKDTGRIINSDRVNQKSITQQSDIVNWKEYFQQIPPAVFVIGDLP
jgi:predicted Zn-dependent peptidase